jgi:hypothetical protein
MEAHQRYWANGTYNYRPMLMENLAQLPLGAEPSTIPFYSPTYGSSHRLNVASKAWSFFKLETDEPQMPGIYFGAGMSESRASRLLEDLDELPLDDFSWAEHSVPNPARPEFTRNACIALLTNWNVPEYTAPLIEAAYKVSDLLFIERLFAQIVHSGPEDHSWIAQQFGYRYLRTCHAKTSERTPVSVWVWERETSKAAIPRHSRSELEATPTQVQALSHFYQFLNRATREELIYLIHGFSIIARVESSGLNQRTIEMRRSHLREALGLNSDRSDDENRERLWKLGIRAEWGSIGDIGSLMSQPSVAQALKRIAWFYGELPEELR